VGDLGGAQGEGSSRAAHEGEARVYLPGRRKKIGKKKRENEI
jgi:hypothetical protein